VIFRSQATAIGRRTLSAVLVAALLSFAHACAAHGGACDTPRSDTGDHCVGHSDTDGCADHDGCGDAPADGCGRTSICCSTWTSPPVSPTVPAPLSAPLPVRATIAALEPGTVFVAALVPIPSESPPPLVSILRL